ncbi:hypothetical protein CASFOL_016813 [Castilleja foliolosa]|uniref:BED-type domain-containing protein n=1 Tax=Castilleja foliolosa TaxID=1961234 RepID=A0ABD3DD87_9LAMI
MDRYPKERKDARMDDQQSDATYEFNRITQPVFSAAWRGRFNIPRQNLNINISAQVSNKACLEVASIMPESLCLEIIPRIDVWPTSFKSSPPSEHNVALFFFPEGRDEQVFDSLVTYASCSDLALKATIGRAEILIFTSIQLPVNIQRFHGKHYLWGVFKGRVSDSHQSEHQLHIRTPIVKLSLSANSCGQRSFDGKESPMTVSSEHSPLTHAAKADRRGRRLDDAWQHAKPLDALRQKAECNYCGFISSHGGISHLKAHLGGGHPKIRLPGCEKVPTEVKRVMAEWFVEWVKKTKALWTKEIRAEAATHDERGNVDWDGQKTDFKYFSFDFSRGEISQHKALPETKGADFVRAKKPKTSVTPPPTKRVLMSEWQKSVSTASRMKESQASGDQSDKRGRPLDNAWQHAKPLDEARQKTQCNYCGFVSMYGGISRLKAHLGGGCPEMQLQGCPQVPLEIKGVMEEWYNEWVKYSTATWTRKSIGGKPSEIHGASAKSLKRGRPLEDTWEHAIALDETRQATKCKYCGFVSKRGGIAPLRAHLVGGDLTMQLEGCPYVPPEVRSSMMVNGVEMKKFREKSRANMETTTEGLLQETTASTGSEALWFERRHHILQETLEGVQKTCLKESLEKLIHDKKTDSQKMQFEIHPLQPVSFNPLKCRFL